MPTKPTHDRLTVITAPAAYAVGSLLLPDDPMAAGVVAAVTHLVSGVALSPDLDITTSHWGPLGWLWLPYMILVPHRSPLSHSLILGPLLRVVYLSAVLAGLLWLMLWVLDMPAMFGDLLNAAQTALAPYKAYAWPGVLGLVTGSAVHTLADVVATRLRRGRV